MLPKIRRKTMATIKKENKPRNVHRRTERRELRQKGYNTSAWRNAREAYLSEHPLCEHCLSMGRVKPAEHVHHKRSPFTGEDVNWALMVDQNNLEALCAECHRLEHERLAGRDSRSPQEILDALDEFFKDLYNEG